MPGSRRWRGGRASSARVDAIDNVGWDAAARTEHAVLAAGEALEVAAAAHCRRSVLLVVRASCVLQLFCLRIARVDSLQAGCSVHSLWAIAAGRIAANSSSGETLIDAHNDLAIAVVGGRVQAPAKRATKRHAYKLYDSNATCYAKQQRSTISEGCYPSQPVAAQTERYMRASVRRALESDF